METAIAGIGHNKPPSDIELLKRRLNDATEDLRSRKNQLTDAFERMPMVILDDDTLNNAIDFTKQIQAAYKAAETLRVREKEPHLYATRIVDNFFQPITQELSRLKGMVEKLTTNYALEKEAAERARIAEARRVAEEAAAKAAEEAALAKANGDNEAAQQAEQQAQVAMERSVDIASQPIAKFQARGDMAMGSLRSKADYEIVDRAALDLEVLRPYLDITTIDKAIKAAMRAGVKEIKGVRFFETKKMVTR